MGQKIKVGDLVEVLYTSAELFADGRYKGVYSKGSRGVVAQCAGFSIRLEGDNKTRSWLAHHQVRVITPRRHADMIIAWAKDDSLVVEEQISEGTYAEVYPPLWESLSTYRFKPSEEEVALEKERQELSSQIKELQLKLDKLGVSSL